MLVIRNAQLEQIARPLLNKLLLKAIVHLRANFSDCIKDRSDEKVFAEFQPLIEDIRKLGLRRDENVMAYFVLCIRYDMSYSKLMLKEPIIEILRDPDFDENEKMYLVNYHLRSEYGRK